MLRLYFIFLYSLLSEQEGFFLALRMEVVSPHFYRSLSLSLSAFLMKTSSEKVLFSESSQHNTTSSSSSSSSHF